MLISPSLSRSKRANASFKHSISVTLMWRSGLALSAIVCQRDHHPVVSPRHASPAVMCHVSRAEMWQKFNFKIVPKGVLDAYSELFKLTQYLKWDKMVAEVRKGGKLESRPENQVLWIYSVAAMLLYFVFSGSGQFRVLINQTDEGELWRQTGWHRSEMVLCLPDHR